MTMTSREQYRAWALECRERAKQSQGFKATYDWIKLAQSWEFLADGGGLRIAPLETNKLQTNST